MIISTERTTDAYLSLNSCGIQKLDAADASRYRPKGRVDYHILYLMDGCCYTPKDGKMIRAKKGDIVLFEPGEPQEYHFYRTDRSVSCYLHFTGTGCRGLLAELDLAGKRIRTVGTAAVIGECFQRMEYECLLRRPFYEQRCTALLLELLTAFGRGQALRTPEAEEKYDHRIDEICQSMVQDCGEWHSMAYYAEKCCLSVSRFQHLFRQSTGRTPNAYLMQLRLEQAAALLTRTDMAVADAAEMLGFKDPNYFVRAFRKYMGKTPMRYRKHLG